MKKISFIVAILLCLALIPALFCVTKTYAASAGTGFSTKYDAETKTLTITGSGKPMNDFYSFYGSKSTTYSPYVSHNEDVTTIVVTNTTHIGNFAFEEYENLTSVVLPENCSVGKFAFKNCTALTSIVIKGDVDENAFQGCTALESVTLIGTKVIGNDAFNGCTSLKSITIPNTVTTIGNYAFGFCYSMSNVTFEEGSSLEYIGDNAFRCNYALTSFAFPTTSASNLKLGEDIFNYCTALTNVNLNSTNAKITKVGYGMFKNCTSLSSLTNVDNVVEVGEYAFQNCSSLKSVSFANALELGRFAFKNSGITSYRLPDGLKVLNQGVFYGCKDLENINYPSTLKNILDSAFQNCSSLPENLVLNEGLIGIDENAYNNSGVRNVYLPSTLAYVRGYAFSSEEDVSFSVHIKNSNTYLFDNAIGLNVTSGIFNAYKNTSIIYAPNNSHARFYANENGLKFNVEGTDTTPDVILSSRLSGSAASSKLYIGGVAIEEFDIIYQDVDYISADNISRVTKTLSQKVFGEYFDYTPSVIKLSEASTSTKSHHIYFIDTTENINKVVNYPFANEETFHPHDARYSSTTKLDAEGFEYIVANGNLYINCGYLRGALYAFDEIFEKWLGGRFLYESLTYTKVNDENVANVSPVYKVTIPSYSLSIPNGAYDYVNSFIVDRSIRQDSLDTVEANDISDLGASLGLRLNSYKMFAHGSRNGYGVGYEGGAHSFADAPDWSEPKHHALDNGFEQPCFTDITTLRKTSEAAVSVLASKSNAWVEYEHYSYSISQNDNGGYKQQDFDYIAENGLHMSDVIVTFINNIADLVKTGNGISKGSTGRLWTLAYMLGQEQPVNTIPRENVQICYAWYGCQSHTIDSDECTCTSMGTSNPAERENFEAWNRLTDEIYIWYYPVTYGYQCAPYQMVFNMLNDIRYFADNGVYGIYFEGVWSDTGSRVIDGYSNEILTAYMQARCMTNPYMSTSEYYSLIREFIEEYYGPDVDLVYRYLQMDKEAGLAAGCFVNQYDWPFDYFSKEYMRDNYVEMAKLLETAYSVASGTQCKHINTMLMHTLYLGVSASTETYVNSTDKNYKSTYETYYKKLISLIKNNDMSMGGSFDEIPNKTNYSQAPIHWYSVFPESRPNWEHVLHLAADIQRELRNYSPETLTQDDIATLNALNSTNEALFDSSYVNQIGTQSAGNWVANMVKAKYASVLNDNKNTIKTLILSLTCTHTNTETRNAKEATCKEAGYTGDVYCVDCNKQISTGTVIDKLTTHTYVDGVCTVCGHEDENYEPNIDVTNEDYGFEISGLTGKANKVTIETLPASNSTFTFIKGLLTKAKTVTVLDINLFDKHDVKVQPSGKVTVSIVIPDEIINSEGDTIKAYHLNGETLEELTIVIEGNKLTFETTGFSVYAISKEVTVDPDPTKPGDDDPTQVDPTKPGDDDPTQVDPTKPGDDNPTQVDPTKPGDDNPTKPVNPDKPEEAKLPIGLIAGIAAGVIVLIVVVVIIVKKKK